MSKDYKKEFMTALMSLGLKYDMSQQDITRLEDIFYYATKKEVKRVSEREIGHDTTHTPGAQGQQRPGVGY